MGKGNHSCLKLQEIDQLCVHLGRDSALEKGEKLLRVRVHLQGVQEVGGSLVDMGWPFLAECLALGELREKVLLLLGLCHGHLAALCLSILLLNLVVLPLKAA